MFYCQHITHVPSFDSITVFSISRKTQTKFYQNIRLFPLDKSLTPKLKVTGSKFNKYLSF